MNALIIQVENILEDMGQLISDRDTIRCPAPTHQIEVGDEVTLANEIHLDFGAGFKTYTHGSIRGTVKEIIGSGARVAFENVSPFENGIREQWILFENICAVEPLCADDLLIGGYLSPHWEEEIPVYEKMGAMSRRVM